MKHLIILFISFAALLLGGCQSGLAPKPLLQKVIILPYEDFAVDPSQPWLNCRYRITHVVIHYGQSQKALDAKYGREGYASATVQGALFYVRRRLQQLPEGSPEQTRLRSTYDRLRAFDNDRRVAAGAIPPFAGRGSSRRMSMIH